MQIGPDLVAKVVLIGWVASEFIFRRAESARGMKPGPADRGTSIQILIAYLISAALMIAGLWAGLPEVDPSWCWGGVVVALAGLGLRWWSMAVLGRFYSRTLLIADGHELIETGPYRYVRHPGYLGSLMVWVGVGMALAPLAIDLLIAVILVVTYLRRITHEEAMLVEALGEPYQAYQKRTFKVLPPVL
jgi:protein-S-isoprenylcysteine O-methyltransferase